MTRTARTAAAALLAVAGCVVAPPPTTAPSDVDRQVAIFTEEMNAHRRSVGCRPLEWDPAVAAVAQAHSEAMRARGFYDHTDPEGRTFTDRLESARIGWLAAAENIARTSFGAEQVLYLWLQSPGHRRNIESCTFTHHGVGLSGDYWTHLFIRPDPRSAGREP